MAGCTATIPGYSECSTHAECREAFGPLRVCGAKGFCRPAERHPRCDQSFPEDLFDAPENLEDAVVFGSLMDRSAGADPPLENAVRLAAEQAEDQGGLEGRTLGLVLCTIEESALYDDLERRDAAEEVALYLAEVIGVPAIIGPTDSDDTQAVYQAVGDLGTLVISPAASSPHLADIDGTPGLLWRTVPSDTLQGAAIAWDLVTPGLGRAAPVTDVAVVFESGHYGDGLATVFFDDFAAAGGTARPFPYQDRFQRDQAISEAAAAASEEILFVSSQTNDIAVFLETTANLAGFDQRIFLTDRAASRDLINEVEAFSAASFPVVRGSRPAPRDRSLDPVFASFITAYEARFDDGWQLSPFTAHAYDAAWLTFYAAVWAVYQEAEVTGAALGRGLGHLSTGYPTPINASTWTLAVERLRGGNSINVSGASGDLDFDPLTEEVAADIQIWELAERGGEWVIQGADVWSPEG